MAWNGSGTFNRITTTVSPAVGGTTIDVADQNTYTADVTAGINACLAKNGENAATANLDMGGFKHQNVNNGSALTDYATLGQVQRGAYNYANDSGSADVYAVTPFPAPTAYTAGQTIRFKASAANTGACTLNVTGASGALGAKNIKTHDIDDPPANAILAGGVYTVIYDGNQFQLQGQTDVDVGFEASATSGSIAATTAAQVAYATEDRDPGSNFAASYYTCPTDGTYHFDAQTTVALLDGAQNMRVFLYKDTGSGDALWKAGQVSHNFNSAGSTALITASVSFTGDCDAGDKISVYAYHTDAGVGSEAVLTTAGYNYFNGTRINLG